MLCAEMITRLLAGLLSVNLWAVFVNPFLRSVCTDE
jgi:hypothetical protein